MICSKAITVGEMDGVSQLSLLLLPVDNRAELAICADIGAPYQESLRLISTQTVRNPPDTLDLCPWPAREQVQSVLRRR